MKIVFFTMTMDKGGAERVISTLCTNWPQGTDELAIVTVLDGESKYSIPANISHTCLVKRSVYFEKGKIGSFFQICKSYRAVLLHEKPDIVVSFLPEPCFVSTIMNGKIKTILVGSERSNPYFQYRNKFIKLLVNALYQRMNGFVCQTEGAKLFFNNKIQSKTVIIPNPISQTYFKPNESVNHSYRIVSVGRFTKEKNYPLLVNAFKLVKEKSDESKLYIYGRIDNELHLDDLISSLGIQNCVFLMGERDNIGEEIKTANVFVLPSKSEGMPNALMEAMALGLPVVATDCPSGGPRQLIQNEGNGLLVENNNAEALANAILRVLNDSEFATRIATNAKAVLIDYSEKKICDKWVSFLQKLYEKKR